MMLEIEYAQALQMSLYYMGYFVPGNSRFDYKRRVGHLEYLDLQSGQWYPEAQLDLGQIPIVTIRKKLEKLQAALSEKHPVVLRQNAFIDANIVEVFPLIYLEHPLILLFEQEPVELQEDYSILITFDVRKDSYLLLECEQLPNGLSNYNPDWLEKLDGQLTHKEEYVIRKVIKQCKTVRPILKWVEGG